MIYTPNDDKCFKLASQVWGTNLNSARKKNFRSTLYVIGKGIIFMNQGESPHPSGRRRS